MSTTTTRTTTSPALGASDSAVDVIARFRANTTTPAAIATWAADHATPTDLTALVGAGAIDPGAAVMLFGAAADRAAAKIRAESARPVAALTLKISAKTGAVVLRGLSGRWPVTLYASQWRRLIDFAPTIIEFLDSHSAEVSHEKGTYTPPADHARRPHFFMPSGKAD